MEYVTRNVLSCGKDFSSPFQERNANQNHSTTLRSLNKMIAVTCVACRPILRLNRHSLCFMMDLTCPVLQWWRWRGFFDSGEWPPVERRKPVLSPPSFPPPQNPSLGSSQVKTLFSNWDTKNISALWHWQASSSPLGGEWSLNFWFLSWKSTKVYHSGTDW